MLRASQRTEVIQSLWKYLEINIRKEKTHLKELEVVTKIWAIAEQEEIAAL